MSSCGAELEAQAVMSALLAGEDTTIPVIDMDSPLYKLPFGVDGEMYKDVTKLDVADLTSGIVNGNGVFDAIQASSAAHLLREFQEGRITGDNYVKAYIALIPSNLENAVQFILSRDTSYWQAQAAQITAIAAAASLETAKMQAISAKFDALNQKATYALTKLRLASESVAYCVAQQQLVNLKAQEELLKEQLETQRSETLDTRTDGSAVAGTRGTQKALYNQQITSYKRSSELGAAKVITDAWITQKTLDDSITAPEVFQNASVNTVVKTLIDNNGLAL